MLRESYELCEIADVFQIPGTPNPAEGLTKKALCKALEDMIRTKNFTLIPYAWIERKLTIWAKAAESHKDTKLAHCKKGECRILKT